MEKEFSSLNESTDEPTKKMLQSLVDKKRKFDKYKKKCLYCQLFTFGTVLAFMGYFYFCILKQSNSDISAMISLFLQQSFHLFFVMSIIAGYATALYFKKKEEKAEKEFHALRCEVIRKSPELWPKPYYWKKREQVFLMMKKKFGINLFYESK
ncbi:YpbF family protein [Metabacillus sp. GX 13764]|uniref:DUF2663 family protein n=1 Tax=Metabacillus kandeliae TaxID=2900151 RepID=UPI001E43523B|nr:DUF2663 family protein [Metabacillus kandeliae]MCD7033335.1 YpbF family protein [Metabacillus kandeliae]